MGFKNLVGRWINKPEDSDNDAPKETNGNKPQRVQFFMCFPNQTEAGEIRDKLDAQGMEVFLRLAEDYTNWLVVVTRVLIPETAEFTQFEGELAIIAESNDGDYQGWEYETVPGFNLYSTD